jgi:hypothetical protein
LKTPLRIYILVLLASSVALAGQAPAKAKSVTKNKPGSRLSTDVRFNDQMVGGQYQVPMEALSVVENEKSIDDLIGVRKNFKDRIEKSKGFR